MRIVFFGTPLFAASILQDLLQSGIQIVAVVTQPDRPQGRDLKVSFSAVKKWLLEKDLQIPILQPLKAKEPEFLSQLASFKADLFVVVAYGQILPDALLSIPPLGSINVHASLLPKYRGAAPIQRCLMQGDAQTGIAIQKIVKELDAGDVIANAPIEIPLHWTSAELSHALCELAKPMLRNVLHLYETGIPPGQKQNSSLVTFAPKIELEEGRVDWNLSALRLHNLIRAFSPKPGAWCSFWVKGEEKRLKILKSEIVNQPGIPGQIIAFDLTIGCGNQSLKLLSVQPEGKKIMTGADFLRGFQALPTFIPSKSVT
jgi:methionyl-tRNA formyltransferase